jgi:hypothetical protein
MGVGGQRHARAALSPEKRPGTHCTGGWLGPSAGWSCAENLVLTEIRSPGRPAHNESLSRVRYPGPIQNVYSKCNSLLSLQAFLNFAARQR